jgi:homoserine kinase type II
LPHLHEKRGSDFPYRSGRRRRMPHDDTASQNTPNRADTAGYDACDDFRVLVNRVAVTMYEVQRQFVLAAYPNDCQPTRFEYLAGAGGFSGARFWRLETARGPLCLRRWPAEHPSPIQLQVVHRVLAHADSRGFKALPIPIATSRGPTFIQHAGHLWELTPWLPGKADWADRPSPARLSAAMMALARFHQAVADFPELVSPKQASPAIRRRFDHLIEWKERGLDELGAALRSGSEDWTEYARRLIALFEPARATIEPALRQAGETIVAQQLCIGDVWHDNVLFDGDEVSGLVDFGTLRTDSVAADIARLLASLAEDDPASWVSGLAAYQSVRPLAPAELALVPILDQAAVLLSGFNWLRWLVIEGRQFDDLARVRARLDLHLRRLTQLVASREQANR